MITEAKLTISGLRARAVNVELKRPVQTSGGEIPTAPLVLIDLETENGTTGRAYVFSYTPLALEPLRRLVTNLGTTLKGHAVAPLEIDRKLQGMFRLLGPLSSGPSSASRPFHSSAWKLGVLGSSDAASRIGGGVGSGRPGYVID